MNIVDKICQLEKDKIGAGEVSPFFIVVSPIEAQELLGLVMSKVENMLTAPTDPQERIMFKIPDMMGRVNNTYIIQSYINREEIKQGALARVALNKIDEYYSDRVYQDDTLVMVTRDWLKYYKEHKDE